MSFRDEYRDTRGAWGSPIWHILSKEMVSLNEKGKHAY